MDEGGFTLEDILESERQQQQADKGLENNLVGEYVLGTVLGEGAYGRVFKALDRRTGHFVAVKQLHMYDDESGSRKQNASTVKKIEKEMRILKSMNHRNVVKYLDSISRGDDMFLVLEFVENGSLLDVIKKFGTFPEHLARLYAAQMVDGLRYLESRTILHRDIKAANILISRDGTCKLADFGVAVQISGSSLSMCSSGNDVGGTPYYMAPEILLGEDATHRSDIWSLGCTIVELLTGRPPYAHLNSMQAVFSIIDGTDPPELPKNLSESARSFLLACFERDPEKRATGTNLAGHAWIADVINKPPIQGKTVKSYRELTMALRTTPRSGSKRSVLCQSIYMERPLDLKALEGARGIVAEEEGDESGGEYDEQEPGGGGVEGTQGHIVEDFGESDSSESEDEDAIGGRAASAPVMETRPQFVECDDTEDMNESLPSFTPFRSMSSDASFESMSHSTTVTPPVPQSSPPRSSTFFNNPIQTRSTQATSGLQRSMQQASIPKQRFDAEAIPGQFASGGANTSVLKSNAEKSQKLRTKSRAAILGGMRDAAAREHYLRLEEEADMLHLVMKRADMALEEARIVREARERELAQTQLTNQELTEKLMLLERAFQSVTSDLGLASIIYGPNLKRDIVMRNASMSSIVLVKMTARRLQSKKKRRCCLLDNFLLIYKMEEHDPCEAIKLDESARLQVDGPTTQCKFDIVAREGKTVHLRVTDERILFNWMKAIAEVKQWYLSASSRRVYSSPSAARAPVSSTPSSEGSDLLGVREGGNIRISARVKDTRSRPSMKDLSDLMLDVSGDGGEQARWNVHRSVGDMTQLGSAMIGRR